ncbi:Ig-like domain repeat protein [Nocardioides sp. GCM10027113]|uniref:Ig-like domain repeat protein n=1 Tax=unclassified Nocardioides TaxID=2615069 RepID=UPI0036216FD5
MDLSTCTSVTKRVAATAAASALAAGALVAASATPAQAVVASTDYVCAVPTVGSFTVPVRMDVPALDAVTQINAGQTVPESLMNLGGTHAVDLTFGLPATLAGTLTSLGGVSALDLPDFGLGLGDASVPLAGAAIGAIRSGDAGALLVGATATNGAFTTPVAGDYPILMPRTFTMVPTVGALGPVPITCATENPGTVKTLPVVKNTSATTAKPAKKKFVKGQAAKLKAVVTGQTLTPSGKVVAKKGAKTVGRGTLDDAGKAVINLGKLKPGVHRFTVKYLGSGYHDKSATEGPVTVKVVR